MFCLPLMSVSFLEEKVYCKTKSNNIIIYFNEEANSTKCINYINALESKKNEIYKELKDFSQYILHGQDEAYRTNLFYQRYQDFNELDNYKNLILQKISTFEHDLFKRSKAFLEPDLKYRYYNLSFRINLLQSRSVLSWEVLWESLGDEGNKDNEDNQENNNIEWNQKEEENQKRQQYLQNLIHTRDTIKQILDAEDLGSLVSAIKLYFLSPSEEWESEL